MAKQMTNACDIHGRGSGQSGAWQGTVAGSLIKGQSLQSVSGKSQMAQSLDPRGQGRASTNQELDTCRRPPIRRPDDLTGSAIGE